MSKHLQRELHKAGRRFCSDFDLHARRARVGVNTRALGSASDVMQSAGRARRMVLGSGARDT